MAQQKSPFNPDDLKTIHRLIATAETATLCTLLPSDDGLEPYASMVLIAADEDGQPMLFISELSEHTQNLHEEPHASLLLREESGDSAGQRLNCARVSLQCAAEFLARADAEPLIDRFVERHSEAQIYRRFSDFQLVKLSVQRAHFIGGFGHARWYEADELFGGAGKRSGFGASLSGFAGAQSIA